MDYSDLKHGDVLLYQWKKHGNFFVRAIRLITGSKIVHSGIVIEKDGDKFIVEAMGYRMHSYVPLYHAYHGEVIYCVRPKFPIPYMPDTLFERRRYGYLNIVDCLVNHFLGLFNSKHVYTPYCAHYFKNTNLMCSALVAKALKLPENTKWCNYIEVVEPDDYWNHNETFTRMGVIRWRMDDV